MRKLSGLLILLIALAGGAASCSTTDIQDAVPGAQPFVACRRDRASARVATLSSCFCTEIPRAAARSVLSL